MQDLEQQLSTSQAQYLPAMYMPYIEGPKMDWTVNDDLHHRFLKLKLKCEKILDCELAMFPDSKNLQESYVMYSSTHYLCLGNSVVYMLYYSLLYCDTQCLSSGSLFFAHLGGIKVKM